MRRALALTALLAVAAPVQAQSGVGRRGAPKAPRGGRIDLDVVQADLHDVTRLLAEVGGINVVLGDEVTGRVTVRLKRVRWDLALRTVLKTRGYELERSGSIWRVAAGKTLADERARKLGARERCLQSGLVRTITVRPSYARAADLAAHLRQNLTTRGSVTVDERTNTVIVRDVICE